MADSARPMSYKEAAATLQLLETVSFGEPGVAPVLWERIRSDTDFRNRVVKFIQAGACAPSREGPLPMHFGPLEWETYFRITLTDEQRAAAENVPWPPDLADQPCPVMEGRLIRHTHFALFGLDVITRDMCRTEMPRSKDALPLDVAGLLELVADPCYSVWKNRPRIVSELGRNGDFPTDQLEMRWHFIPLVRPPASTRIRHDEKMPNGYQVATLVEYLAARIFYFLLKTGHPRSWDSIHPASSDRAPLAVCGAPPRILDDGRPGDYAFNQVVGTGDTEGLHVCETMLTASAGSPEWFTALSRKPEPDTP
jgi:hypothetical protein